MLAKIFYKQKLLLRIQCYPAVPFTFSLIRYRPLLAVIKRLFISGPPKQTFAVQLSGTAIFPILLPFLSKIVTPFPVR
jgi:hypothetical protein